jgi:hypothetical protein
MKEPAVKIISLIMLLLVLCGPGWGAVDINGRFNLFSSVYLGDQLTSPFMAHEAGQFALKRLETQLRLSSQINDKLNWGLRLDLAASGGDRNSPGIFNESSLLASPSGSETLEISLFEAYARVSDFILSGLDLTVGKQRITWGTADKIGVLDNLNPLDMAQFFTFSPEHFFERRPQTALNFEYYFKNREKLQVVLLLQKQIAPLPYGFNALMTQLTPGFTTLSVANAWGPDTLGSLNWGARFSATWLNLDWGLSLYRGNQQTPSLSVIAPLSGEARFLYPLITVLGLDLAGEAHGIGFWAELGLYLPTQAEAELRAVVPTPDGLVPITLQGDLFQTAFFKYVIGADYHFGGGWYTNVQFLHGFFDETAYSDFARQNFRIQEGFFFGDIADTLFFRLEKKLWDDKLQIKMSNIFDLIKGGGWTLLPEVELRLHDSFSLQGGLFLPLSGDPQKSRFAFFEENKLFYLMFRLEF